MEKVDQPRWLTEIQHKSWEPEILISGITLTSLFFLSHHIYNFFGMLIQEYGIWHTHGKSMYVIFIGILNGLKIILIIHLLMRAFWTGMVGLSYVFPQGVNRQNLQKSTSNIIQAKPVDFVIRSERVCSLLFSFIFTSLIYVFGIFVVFVPIILLFLSGLDRSLIRMIVLFVFLPLIVLLSIFLIILTEKAKKPNSKKPPQFLFIVDTLLAIYYSNVGKLKTNAVFLLYFLIIIFISSPEFGRFDFDNQVKEKNRAISGITHIDQDHYEDMRNPGHRIPRATLDHYLTDDSSIQLFTGFYKQDRFTVENLKSTPDLLKKSEIKTKKDALDLPDLYRIYIDRVVVSGLKWFSTSSVSTGQNGLMVTIPIDHLPSGYHQVRIDKVFWSIKEKEIQIISDWTKIPFQVGK